MTKTNLVGSDTLAHIDEMLSTRYKLYFLSGNHSLEYSITRDTRTAAPYMLAIDSGKEQVYCKRYTSLQMLVASEPFDLGKFKYERRR